MAHNPNTGFRYRLGLSSRGIIHNGEDGRPRFLYREGLTHTPNHPQDFLACSSSRGLVAYHNPNSNAYHICNPNRHGICFDLPQPPRPHHPSSTHVVLVVEKDIYHLVCAVPEEDSTPNMYIFDVYRSFIGDWVTYCAVDVRGHIIPNTGVPCGSFAYWLTEMPHSVIRFNIYNAHEGWQGLPPHVDLDVPGIRFQLGTIGDDLGLVTVDACRNPRVLLHLLEDGNPPQWVMTRPIYLRNVNPTLYPLRLIRFQSFKLEIFFWFNEQVMLLEMSTVDPHPLSLPIVSREGVHVADGFSYVVTLTTPADFPNINDFNV